MCIRDRCITVTFLTVSGLAAKGLGLNLNVSPSYTNSSSVCRDCGKTIENLKETAAKARSQISFEKSEYINLNTKEWFWAMKIKMVISKRLKSWNSDILTQNTDEKTLIENGREMWGNAQTVITFTNAIAILSDQIETLVVLSLIHI